MPIEETGWEMVEYLVVFVLGAITTAAALLVSLGIARIYDWKEEIEKTIEFRKQDILSKGTEKHFYHCPGCGKIYEIIEPIYSAINIRCEHDEDGSVYLTQRVTQNEVNKLKRGEK